MGSLFNLDKSVKTILRLTTITIEKLLPFFASRKMGGLGIGKLNQKSDTWKISKPTQL